MKPETLKKRIVKKFGTLARFARCAQLNYEELRLFFKNCGYKMTEPREQKLRWLKSLSDTLVTEDPDLITKREIERVRKGIRSRFGTNHNFCKFYPDLDESFVSRFLAGKVKTKGEGKRARKIVNVFTEVETL